MYDRLHSQRLSSRGKALQPATVERSFEENKELHGFRFARYRGVQKVTIQALMTAISQNLKKWAKLRSLPESSIGLGYRKREKEEKIVHKKVPEFQGFYGLPRFSTPCGI